MWGIYWEELSLLKMVCLNTINSKQLRVSGLVISWHNIEVCILI